VSLPVLMSHCSIIFFSEYTFMEDVELEAIV